MNRHWTWFFLALGALLLGGGCEEGELTGPAAPEEVASTLFQPVVYEDAVYGWLLVSEDTFECNHLIGYVDEGEDTDTFIEDLEVGRHLLATLRREPSLEWSGLYAGVTEETLTLADLTSNRMSTARIFMDGEEIVSEIGGYVMLESYQEDEQSSGSLGLGVVDGTFTADVCGPLDRSEETGP